MINWKSLFFFLLTLTLILTITTGAIWFGYNKGIEVLAALHPEIMRTPSSATVYTVSKGYLREFEEYKDPARGYSIMIPKKSKIEKTKEDPSVTIVDPEEKWEITIKEKLLRYDETIQGTRFLNNPEGDHFKLLDATLRTRIDPFLLAQKALYLPSSTRAIKTIQTPNFPQGFMIVAKSGEHRYEIYRLFDEDYWHNIFVTIYDPDYPHEKLQTILATLKNDIYMPPEEKMNRF